jgi:hypothetical protein
MPGLLISALVDDSDAVATGSVGAVSISRLTGFNGSTYDRLRTLGGTSLNGLGQASVSPAVPGASVVKGLLGQINNSTTRTTLITPASGKRIRVTSVGVNWSNATGTWFEVYFGSGANITTTAANAVAIASVDLDTAFQWFRSWPDGGGPVGAADAVLSGRVNDAVAELANFVVHYREE